MSVAYRFLAIDVDGTLLDTSDRLPSANRDALHRAHEAGLFVCLCTGRCYAETRPVMDRIGLDLDAAVCVFGAIVNDARTGKTLHRWPIPQRTARRLIEFFSARGHSVFVLQDPTEALTDYYIVNGVRETAAVDRWLAQAPTTCQRVAGWPADAPEPVRIGVIEQPEHAPALAAELTAAFGPNEVKSNTIFAPNYGLHVVECFAPHVNKWHAIERLARDRGIHAAEVVAVGDDVNDIEMIRSAGLGVAMGNAIEAVRAVARVRTGTNNEAGLAAVVNRMLDGEFDGVAAR
ncbi:MAG: HAD family hydrolase [Phycisphaerae bacterium]|nr:HAD family hydrolase [Phycisphaerae bacterium]